MVFTFTLHTLTRYILPGTDDSIRQKVVVYDGKSRISPADRVPVRLTVTDTLTKCSNSISAEPGTLSARSDLVKAVSGRTLIQVEELTRNWEYYLGVTSGLAQVSVSGKALNIDLFGAGSFTLSLNTLRAVLYGKERLAVIVRIPESPAQKLRRVAVGQQTIGAVV